MKKYTITLRTMYGSLTVDDIKADTEKEAVIFAEEAAIFDLENFSKVDQIEFYEH